MPTSESLLHALFPGADAEQERLRDRIQVMQIPAGQVVFHRGDACRNYLVVVEGSVKVQVFSQGGREVVLYRVRDGESCVITTSCLISHETYPAEGVTETDTTALIVSEPVFEQALAHVPEFRRYVFANQGRRLGDLILRLEDIAFGRLDERLARLLFERSEQGSRAVQATHQVLASELGTAREVVSRQLKSFEQQGLIAIRRGSINILKPELLESIWH